MKSAVLGASLLALSSTAESQNVVGFDLKRGPPGHLRVPSSLPFLKRDTHTATLLNNITGGGYYIDVEVGTPGQPQTMVLDTGSSDAWIVAYNADLCTDKSLQRYYGDTCGATYNPSSSSTYVRKIRNGFAITYVDGTSSSGDYITDNFAVAGVTISALQMGLATTIVRGVGVLGIGFPANEASTRLYPNIIDQLADQNFVKSRAFSLYLNDRRSSQGTILFGGVDTDKFIGSLNVLPILKSASGNYTHYTVAMSSLKTTYSNGSTVTTKLSTIPAILDSGTTLSYIPDSVATPLFKQFGIYVDPQSGLALVSCDYLTTQPHLAMTFGFGSSPSGTFSIAVPVGEMVLDVFGGYESVLPPEIPFDSTCLFGLQSSDGFTSSGGSSTGNYALLGDSFLRSAYVVYDLDHGQIGMAQANLNSSETKVTELTSAGAGMPTTFVGVASQQTTVTPTASGGKSTGTGGASSTTGTGGGGQTTVTVTASGNAGGGRVGGGGREVVGVVVLVSCLVGLGSGLFML